MKDICQQEVNDLHQFFEDWFSGAVPQTEESFSRVQRALSDDFAIVGPNGRLTARDPLLHGLYAAYLGRPNFRIWIENYALQQQIGNIAIVTYEEWQEIDGESTSRLSTAVFQKASSAPNGVQWLHVHEAWQDK